MSIYINQMSLVNAIFAEISRQNPEVYAIPRQCNKIIEAANSICDEFLIGFKGITPNMGMTAWMSSDEAGSSSKYLLSVTQQSAPEFPFAEPSDYDDLQRCFKLEVAVPGCAAHLYKIKDKSPLWAEIAQNWDAWWVLFNTNKHEEIIEQFEEIKSKLENSSHDR